MNIDVKLITDNLVELLTNTINVSSLFEKVFYSKEPDRNIELVQYVYKEDTQKIEPELTKIKNVAAIEEELRNSIGRSTVILTQEEYDALEEKDPEILYFIY